MKIELLSLLFLLAIVVDFATCYQDESQPQSFPGIVILDELNFDKTVKKFPYAFVMISDDSNVKSSTDKKSEFVKLCVEYLSHNSDVLAAEIRLNWGEPETKRLATRFEISDNRALPEFILYKVDGDKNRPSRKLVANETRFGGDVKSEKILEFLKSKTGVYIGRQGCFEKLDDFAESFVRNSAGKDRQKLIREVEALIQDLSDKKQELIIKIQKLFCRNISVMNQAAAEEEELKSGKVYLKIMKALASASNSSDLAKYVSSETSRVSKLMTTKNVDSKKKKEFQLKLNILASFK